MAKAKKYTREAILASKEFEAYQQDFVKALLVKPEYTLAEAKEVVEAFFMKEK